jgi:hypothetical protein
MSNPRNAVLCLHCGERASRPPKTTFLGFRKFRCGQCSKVSLYPLSGGYFAVYWTAIILAVIFSAVMLFQGDIPIPGILFFAAIYGLWRDRQLCRSISSKPPAEHTCQTSCQIGLGLRSKRPTLPPRIQTPRLNQTHPLPNQGQNDDGRTDGSAAVIPSPSLICVNLCASVAQ